MNVIIHLFLASQATLEACSSTYLKRLLILSSMSTLCPTKLTKEIDVDVMVAAPKDVGRVSNGRTNGRIVTYVTRRL
jgi:hypothetical protein